MTMDLFDLDELESIADLARERAEMLRGYVSTARIHGELHWRGIAEIAEQERERRILAGERP